MSRKISEANGLGLLGELRALAACLADEIDRCKGGSIDQLKILPGLSRQYRETVVKIDALESGIDANDDIATIILRNRKSDTD